MLGENGVGNGDVGESGGEENGCEGMAGKEVEEDGANVRTEKCVGERRDEYRWQQRARVWNDSEWVRWVAVAGSGNCWSD